MKRRAKAFSAVVFIAVVFISVPACHFSGDTARVTIDTGLRNQQAAKVSLLDRFLALVSFSKPAMADPAPMGIIYRITVSVTDTGISSMNDIEIPLDTGLIILDVPAGSGRTFTVIGWNESSQREYGGIKTVNLQGGSAVNLTIQMGLLPDPPDEVNGNRIDINSPDDHYITWGYDLGEPVGLIGFVVYRSTESSVGPYSQIISGRKEDFDSNGYRYDLLKAEQNVEQYDCYKISATNQYGEGNLSNFYYSAC